MKKTSQTAYRIEKVMKKGDKIYVNWKGYNKTFNN